MIETVTWDTASWSYSQETLELTMPEETFYLCSLISVLTYTQESFTNWTAGRITVGDNQEDPGHINVKNTGQVLPHDAVVERRLSVIFIS